MAELLFQELGTEICFPGVTWISPGCPQCGVHPAQKKSELRAHQMARKFEVPGSPRTKIRAELSSNGSDVRPAGLTPHKKSTPRSYGMGIVGRREFPGSLGRHSLRLLQCGAWACSSTSSANHHFCVPPTGSVLHEGWSCGQCTRWRASRGVSCCGSHYPLPRRCGDVTFSLTP